MNSESETNWLWVPPEAPPAIKPPVTTRIQKLPLNKLTWPDFQRLCAHLAQREGDVEYVQEYGIPGQKQDAIDIYIRRRMSAKYSAWQCKRYQKVADLAESLDYPHRWNGASKALGEWIQDARRALMHGEQIKLSCVPPDAVKVIRADNTASGYGQYRVDREERHPIDASIEGDGSTLVLASQSATVSALRPFFNRRLPMWEGHVRKHLDSFASAIAGSAGNAHDLAVAMIDFLGNVAVGFSRSTYGNRLLEEIDSGCTATRRGKTQAVQQIARAIIDSPDQAGVGRALRHIETLSVSDRRFNGIKIDCRREFCDAIAICEHPESQAAVSELARRRTFSRPSPPPKAISTIHKAKGMEVDRVVVLPCDKQHFGNKQHHRNRFYVAISRAKRQITLVVPIRDMTPLLQIDQASVSKSPPQLIATDGPYSEIRREVYIT